MSKEADAPKTPDESIPQDPGIPGPGTKESEWPPESGTEAGTSEPGLTRDAREREETTVSEASGPTKSAKPSDSAICGVI